jgi:hypothetical protein
MVGREHKAQGCSSNVEYNDSTAQHNEADFLHSRSGKIEYELCLQKLSNFKICPVVLQLSALKLSGE